MKKLLLLLFPLILSFNSYGEWTLFGEDESNESNYFIDLESVKKQDKYIYWWMLVDFFLPLEDELDVYEGDMSAKSFVQGDCELNRTKFLSLYTFKKPMGEEASSMDLAETNPKWDYLPPDSMGESMLYLSCGMGEKFEELSAKEYLKFIERVKAEIIIELKKAEAEAEAEAEIQYRQLLAKEVQDEQDTARSLIIQDQLNTLQSAYINNIAARVYSFWRYQSAESHWTAEVYVIQDRDGNVKAVDVKNANVGNSSLAKTFIDSIERAVYKASPLPGAPDEAVFDKELYFIFSVK